MRLIDDSFCYKNSYYSPLLHYRKVTKTMPIILCLFVLLVIWVQIEISKSRRTATKDTDEFWKKERQANLTRKKDLSDLPYLTIHFDSLPIHHNTADSTLQDYYTRIESLKDKKILNLSSKSNTELKSEYGIANLDFLSACDQAYNTLIVTLNKWGNYLYDTKQYEDALLVLEYALECDSDISSTYITLAKLYLLKQDCKSVDSLLERAKTLHSSMKNSIISTIEDLKLKDLLTASDHTEI
ncbi:hypothetical protein lbkm_3529 [Lachnospiraceae bacterium KM106-2]|nr:hypothetical protein lbkm_3529 [Lachnospiraceae bacterium KM106-2]